MLLLIPLLIAVEEVVAREEMLTDVDDPLTEALEDTDEMLAPEEREVDDADDVEEYPSAESLKTA